MLLLVVISLWVSTVMPDDSLLIFDWCWVSDLLFTFLFSETGIIPTSYSRYLISVKLKLNMLPVHPEYVRRCIWFKFPNINIYFEHKLEVLRISCGRKNNASRVFLALGWYSWH